MAFIAGQYTATWNSLAVGQIAQGIQLEHTFFKKLITGDNFADTPQDAIFRGAELFAQYNLMEYNAAACPTIFWPYNTTFLNMGVIGRLDVASSLTKTLLMTAIAGTPAAATPATITLTNSILAEGFPVALLFIPDLREVPIRQRIYPNSSGVFGTLT